MKVYAAPSMSDEEEQEEQANDIQKKKREEEEEPEHQHSYSYSDTREEKDDVQEEEEEIPAPMIVIEQKTNPSKDATVIPVGSISENVTVPSFHEASSQSQEVPPLLQLYVSKESPGTNLRTLRAMAHTLRMPLSLSKSKSNSSSNSTNERSSSSSSSPTKEPGNTPGVVKRSGSVTALLQRRNTLKRIKDFNNRAALIQQKDSVVPDGNSGNSSNSSNSGDNGNNNDNDDSGGGGIVEIPTNIKKELTLEEARRHFLILPTDFSFWICWNSIHLLVLCYLCTIVPYLTAFNHDSTNTSGSSSYTYLNRLIDFFYVLDIFVNFRSCYMDFETGEMIYDV
jgi:hypothetical protein